MIKMKKMPNVIIYFKKRLKKLEKHILNTQNIQKIRLKHL